MTQSDHGHDLARARLMLAGLCLSWGLTWPAMRIALTGIPPFSMRAASTFIGAVALLAAARLQRKSVRLENAKVWLHVAVVSFFNIVAFSVFTTFAQLNTLTSRVTIIVYTMPIWAAVMAWLLLGERLDLVRGIALLSCCVGLGVLIYPVAEAGLPLGILLALGASVGWAAGTIYMKWAKIHAEPFAIAAWQLVIGCIVLTACAFVVEGSLHIAGAPASALAGMAFSGLFGSGLAYLLWYSVIQILPAMTASLGALSAPVIGVISSALILGERPTTTDVVGFALIFAASVCVILKPAPVTSVKAKPALPE